MAITRIRAPKICGIVSSVPSRQVDQLAEDTVFGAEEAAKVVRLAGVKTRHAADDAMRGSAQRMQVNLSVQ
jgi:hypothetical protein